MQLNKISVNTFQSHQISKIKNINNKLPELCLFCGTFNPIHNGHLRIAQYALDKYGMGKILFIPSAIPPHKKTLGIDMFDRLNMVKLATEGNPKFEVSDIEFRKDKVSYTYNTILELKKIFNKEKFSFLIGTDAFKQIETWYSSSKLKDLLKFIVFPRENSLNKESFELLKKNGYDFDFMNLEFLDISSTEIRDRIKNGEDISELISPSVEKYIKENNLYKN